MKAREDNGQIRVYTRLPKIWNNNINFHLLEDSVHEENGFYHYEQPEKTEYQKYVEIVFTDGKFVRQVVDMTAEEIAEYEENKAENEANELLDIEISDGIQATKKIRIYILRQFKSGNLTNNQFKNIRISLIPIFKYLKGGDWDLAQNEINSITPPTNAKLLEIYNKLKNKIDEYLLSA